MALGRALPRAQADGASKDNLLGSAKAHRAKTAKNFPPFSPFLGQQSPTSIPDSIRIHAVIPAGRCRACYAICMTDQPLPLAERVRIAGLNASVARASYDIWWIYAGVDTRPQYIEAMNDYSEFFRFDQHAHFIAVVVGVSSLFDTTDGTITVRSVVNKAVADGFMEAKPLVSVVDRLQADRRVIGVAHLRNKLLAHRDNRLSYRQAFKDAGIAPDDLRDLLQEAFNVIGRIADLVDVTGPIHNTIVGDHAEAMLQKLRASS